MTVEMDEGHNAQDSGGNASSGGDAPASSVVRYRAWFIVLQRAWYVLRERASRVWRPVASFVVRWRILKWTAIALGVVVLAAALFLSVTETGRYLARAGWEETKILWRRRDIIEMVADTTVDRLTRRKLHIVLEWRQFASA